MHITSLLHERNIIMDLEASSKEEALENLIARVARGPKVLDVGKIHDTVLERERLATTGIGEGFAIPHAKTDAVLDILVAIAVLREPIDFRSMDDQPVRIIFLLVGVESRVGTYLKLLSRARRLMSSASFRKKILQAKAAANVLTAFSEEEERYFETA